MKPVLRASRQELEGAVSRYRSEVTSTIVQTLPKILDELSELQGMPVLFGDYSMKYARQQYHLQKQDEEGLFFLEY